MNESDMALDVEEAVVVGEACEARQRASFQIYAAGRCTTRG